MLTFAKRYRMSYSKAVIIWLWIGLFMVFMQIIIGGVTRLTGSGLSITKWEIVTGTIPPINQAQWEAEFELYKKTPQYEKINDGMTLRSFKFIFFWEYFHRLWARTMGFVFLFPFLYFLFRKQIDKPVIIDLSRVIFFAALAAIFGWIMVASGLVNRPWVNAYKLSIHLGIGFAVFGALLWTIFKAQLQEHIGSNNSRFKRDSKLFIYLLIIQILLGGMMSGMKAGLFYPTWPLIDGGLFPMVLFEASKWSVDNLVNYDQDLFMSGLIQSLHRTLAYIVFIYGLVIAWRYRKVVKYSLSVYFLLIILCAQVLLGILTLINSIGSVPVLLGVLHQGVGIILFGAALYFVFINKNDKSENIQKI